MQQPVKLSVVFDAFRQATVIELKDALINAFLPEFKAEQEDILRQYEETTPSNEALANNKRRARELSLRAKRDQFIKQMQMELHSKCLAVVEEHHGEVEEIEDHNRKVMVAKFPDGSKTVMPRGIWIDYAIFA